MDAWSKANNLQLNRAKSVEIVFTDNKRKPHLRDLPVVNGMQRLTEIKVLGVTVTSRLSVSGHITNVLQSCARSMYALRVLRSHGLSNPDLQIVFRAVVVSKLVYASCAWIGFATAADRNKIDKFLARCTRLGYCEGESFSDLCELADSRLFQKVMNNRDHILNIYLPPHSKRSYDLRLRRHSHTLPVKGSKLNSSNFVIRLLFKDVY